MTWTGKVTAVSPGRLIDVLIADDRQGKPALGQHVVLRAERDEENLQADLVELRDTLEDTQRDAQRELATVTSERDYLRERFRELAESFDVEAERWHDHADAGSAIAAARYAAWAAAAAKLRQIVAESEDGRNGTATPA